jgi:hypothetical protein
MPPKAEGVYRLSPRGMVIVDKYGYGSVMDTLLGMDRDIELLKSLINVSYTVRKDDPALVG